MAHTYALEAVLGPGSAPGGINDMMSEGLTEPTLLTPRPPDVDVIKNIGSEAYLSPRS